MNFGIIGFGNIARRFAEGIEATDEGRITAIASRSLSTDDPYLAAHPQIKYYKHYEDLLRDPKIDAVYIALTHKFHKQWILQAMEHRIPILCEKPLVLSSAEVDEIQAKGKETGTYCLEAFKTKFNTGFSHLKKDLSLIGKILDVQTSFCSDASGMPSDCFLFDPEQGGALNDIGSYVLGFILAICPESIENVSSILKVENGIETYFSADLSFSGGCTGHAEGAIDRRKDRTAFINGSLGTIEIPFYNRITNYTIRLKNGSVIERNFPIHGNDMTMEIQTMIQDVKSGKIENGLHTLNDTKNILILSEKIRAMAKPTVS